MWEIYTLANSSLAAHFQFKLPLFVQIYFPEVRAPESTKQMRVSGD